MIFHVECSVARQKFDFGQPLMDTLIHKFRHPSNGFSVAQNSRARALNMRAILHHNWFLKRSSKRLKKNANKTFHSFLGLLSHAINVGKCFFPLFRRTNTMEEGKNVKVPILIFQPIVGRPRRNSPLSSFGLSHYHSGPCQPLPF